MCHGLPNFAQIIYEIKTPPSASQPPPGTPPAGDDQELQRPLTRYAVDFVIVTKLSILPLWSYKTTVTSRFPLCKPSKISLTGQTYRAAEARWVQLHYDIDVPKDEISRGDISLRTGLTTSTVGTLEVPLITRVDRRLTIPKRDK
jgi:hypothetical protein